MECSVDSYYGLLQGAVLSALLCVGPSYVSACRQRNPQLGMAWTMPRNGLDGWRIIYDNLVVLQDISAIRMFKICADQPLSTCWLQMSWHQDISNHHAGFILKIVFKFYINHVMYLALQPLNKLSWEVNSLWLSDAIWRHRSWSTLAQVRACCLTAPSHYLNQCWLMASMDQWHLSKGNFTRDTPAIIHKNQLQFD